MFFDPYLYRKLVGRLLYILVSTRPGICYCAQQLSQFVVAPLEESRPFYIYSVMLIGHLFRFCIFLGFSLISWKTKKQPTVSHLSTELEYRSMASTTVELLWLSYLLQDYRFPYLFLLPCFVIIDLHNSWLQIPTSLGNPNTLLWIITL